MPSGTWIFDGSDNWSNAARWQNGDVADGAEFTANFTLNITAARTVTLDTARTIETINFADSNASGSFWTLAGSNALTLQGDAPVVSTATGTRVNAPLAGTSGFTHSGGQALSTSTSNSVSGNITLNNANYQLGSLAINAAVPSGAASLGGATAALNVFPNVNTFICNAVTAGVFYESSAGGTVPNNFSGPGFVQLRVYGSGARTYTFTGDMSGMTGTDLVANTYGQIASGFSLRTDTPAPYTARSATAVLASLPAQICIGGSATSAAFTNIIRYVGPGATALRRIHLWNQGGSNWATTTVCKFESSGTTPVNMDLGIYRNDPVTGNFTTFRLGGTNTDDNIISGPIASNGGRIDLIKEDGGRWVFSGANTYAGSTTISAGTLSAQSTAALGTTGAVSITSTGVLELAGNVTVNKSSGAFTIHPSNPITSIGDNTLQTAGITLSGTTTFTIATGNRLAIANTGAITDGASTFGITKAGGGELALGAFSNTYDGTVSVSAGTLAFNSSGALGTGAVQVTATLKYAGAGETVSRAITLIGAAPSLEAAGTNAVTFSNLAQDSTTKTLTLKGANTGSNTVSASLSNSSNPLSLAKEGAGTWVATGALSYTGTTTVTAGTLILTGALSYTGTTAVNGGTLRVQTANSNTTSGAVTIGASGTVELVTNTLASAGITSGEVLGTSSVTVNGGTIKTRGGTTQKGQVRYGGNLTFESGSSLYLGAAA